jgi:hypothetical protein
MNLYPRILVPTAAVVTAAAVAGVLAAHVYGNSATAGSNSAAASGNLASASRGTALTAAAAAGIAAHPPIHCGQTETAIGYVGVDKSSELSAAGKPTAVKNTSGTGVLAQVTDSATGQVLTITRSPAALPAVERSRDSAASSSWLPVYPQAKQDDLRSCEMTLADRPAARPIIDSALSGLVHARYFSSLSKLGAQVQAALISDDPAESGSVIVTILVEGPVYQPVAPPGAKMGSHPPMHRLVAYTALEVASTARVVGVASGGF